MKNLFRALMVMTILSPLAQAKSEKLGLGAILGDPTGISIKYQTGVVGIDGALSYSHDELIIYGDYLRHFPGKFGKQNAFVAALTPYVGVGPVFAFDDDDHDHQHRHNHFIEDDEDDDWAMGARVPLGVEWMATELPIGVGLEIAPGLKIAPDTDAFVQGGLTVRYYF